MILEDKDPFPRILQLILRHVPSCRDINPNHPMQHQGIFSLRLHGTDRDKASIAVIR